jgi:hypothetical protein
MDMDNKLLVQKTRCPALTGQVFNKPGKGVADMLTAWLSGEAHAPAPHWIDDPKVKAALFAWLKDKDLTYEGVKAKLGIQHIHEFTGSREEFKQAVTDALAKTEEA